MTGQSDYEVHAAHERSLLGGIVVAAFGRRDYEIMEVLPDLTPDIFVLPKNREIASAIISVLEEEGGINRVGDTTRLFSELKRGTFNSIQDLDSYLISGESAMDLVVAVKVVRTNHQAREMRRTFEDLINRLDAGLDPSTVLDHGMSRMGDFCQGERTATAKPYDVALDEAEEFILGNVARHRAGEQFPYATSGLLAVDDSLDGGLMSSELAVLAARPGHGKTALGLQWVKWSVASRQEMDPKAYGVVVTLEMTALELILRDLADTTGIWTREFKQGTLSEKQVEQVLAAIRILKGSRQIILHESVQSLSQMQAAIRGDVVRKGGTAPVIVMVDYLQLVDSEVERGANEANSIGRVTRACKLLAKEIKAPILLLSQLNREVESRSSGSVAAKPRMADLRGSGAIEQDANVIIFLSPVKPSEKEDAAEKRAPERDMTISIAKNRSGPTVDIEAKFIKAKTRFECLTGTRETDGRVPANAAVTRMLPPMEDGDF